MNDKCVVLNAKKMNFDGKLDFSVLSSDVTVYDDTTEQQLSERIQGADIIETKEMPVSAEKIQKFDLFRIKYLEIKNETKATAEEWQEYDGYIVGSDIVWGKEFSNLDPVNFLQFAPESSIKIAYAASTILSENGMTENDEIFSKYLTTYDAIAVREKSEVKIELSFVSGKVVDVLDPTLLLAKEEYALLEVETPEMYKKPYILSYFLTHVPAEVDYTNMIAEKLELRVIH